MLELHYRNSVPESVVGDMTTYHKCQTTWLIVWGGKNHRIISARIPQLAHCTSFLGHSYAIDGLSIGEASTLTDSNPKLLSSYVWPSYVAVP